MPTERLRVIAADITSLQVDVIVNAANTSLLGGGGVDGAIHAAAGPQLLEACRRLHGCGYGEAKITDGYALPARYVIHTVGPIYGRHGGREAELLRSCYLSSLRLADEVSAASVAFPAISTGVYGYPKAEAAAVAVGAVRDYFNEEPGSGIGEVLLVAFTTADAQVLQEALAA